MVKRNRKLKSATAGASSRRPSVDRGHVYRTRTAHASNAGRLAAPLARGAQHRRDCHGGTPAPPRGTQNPLWCQPRDGRGTGRDRGREMAHTMVTHRETASRWAAEPLCQSHIITRISRSAARENPRSSPCALHCSRNPPATMGLALRSDERNSCRHLRSPRPAHLAALWRATCTHRMPTTRRRLPTPTQLLRNAQLLRKPARRAGSRGHRKLPG
jgi:hypothetical protein